MSGETLGSVSGWTVDTLKEHAQGQLDQLKIQLDERFATQTKAVDAAFAAAERAVATALSTAEKAVNKAENAAEKRFESVNEFRQSLNDIVGKTLSRAEATATFKSQDEKVAALQARLDKLEGRSTGISASWGYLIGIIGIIGAVLAIVLSLVP